MPKARISTPPLSREFTGVSEEPGVGGRMLRDVADARGGIRALSQETQLNRESL